MELVLVPNSPGRAIAIMREVAAWGRERGLRVWPEQWLTPEELLTDEAGRSNFYVGTLDGEEACAFILQWGMTAQVVEAVKEECARRGVRRLRLDTGAEETAVGRIYLAAGFELVRTIERDGRPSMLLYELTL